MLNGHVFEAPAGSKGFDCNTIVSPQAAKAFKQAGWDFAIRYVGRHATAPQDIMPKEAEGILASGLGLMLVQHVQNPGWVPSGAMGTEYGAFARDSANVIGYVPGAMIWLDMEGVKAGTDPQAVIDFCNNWIDQVGHAGFTPGCYIGFEPGLNGLHFYSLTRFEHFWQAYNGDVVPNVRGFCMKQHTQQTLAGITFDPNTVQKDLLGILPLVLVVPPNPPVIG
jgi:hypothetical protein